MAAGDFGAVVIGAGAAGLAAAHALRARGVSELCVLEAGDRPGGTLRSARVGGHLLERGPNTILVKAPALALLRRLGLEPRLCQAAPASRLRFLWHAGRLEPLPLGAGSALRTPLLSARGKLRVLAEPFVKGGDATGESVEAFVARRLGPEVARRLVGPFLTGIYAGDERELGAEVVFARLVEWEREHGSLLRGALAARRAGGPRGLRGTWSMQEGLEALARALAEGLGEALWLRTRAVSLTREDGVFVVGVAGPGGQRTLRASRVVVATPAHEAAALLQHLAPDAAQQLDAIDYAPVVSISLSVDPAAVRHPIEGFGFLVPREAGLRLLGCLFLSRLFPGRAPAGRELLTCMVGGTRWRAATEAPEDALLGALHADLDRTLGLRAAPETLAVTRWPRAVAQPGREHPRQLAALHKSLAMLPGLRLAGAYLDGVSVSDAIASGLTAGDRP